MSPQEQAWNDQRAVADIKRGGQEGLKYIYDCYGAKLVAYYLRRYPQLDKSDAEDILQDCFLRFYKSIDHYQPEKSKVYTYLATIYQNCCIDFLKNKSIYSSLDGLEEESFDVSFEELYQLHQIWQQFTAKHQKCADALTLQLDGKYIEEIANALGRSQTATTTFLSECRKKLKSLWQLI
jgi:RNA polymerase sigma factor (sigma-70 family)